MVSKNNCLVFSQSSKYYSTKFAPPKKESKDKKLSSNIQKFLAKRDEEEREKAKIARQKKEELLAMRDTKAKNKINKMLKTIKSANKSVLDDAIDHQDTAITLQGPDQPDEDDYGYTSQEASALYSKLMEKYKSMPDEKKFDFSKKALSKDEIKSAKDRVKAAIDREQEEENLPHRRQRQSKLSSSESKSDNNDRSVKSSSEYRDDPAPKPEKPKVKKKHPPPPAMDFQQLLKLAEQKQFEPIQIDSTKVIKEPERLMTQKEKREMEERRAVLEAREKRRAERENAGKMPPPPAPVNKMEPNGRIPKLNKSGSSASSKDEIIPNINGKSDSRPANRPVQQISKKPASGTPPSKMSRLDSENTSSSNKLYSALTKTSSSSQNSTRSPGSSGSSQNCRSQETNRNKEQDRGSSSKSSSVQTQRLSSSLNKKPISQSQPSSKLSVSSSSSSVIKSKTPQKLPEKTREFPPKDIKRKSPLSDAKPRQFPPADIKTRKFPPSDVRGGSGSSREFPPRDVQRSKKPPPPKSMHIIIYLISHFYFYFLFC